jgi:hypothetical protein
MDSKMDTVTVNFLNGHNGSYGRYDVTQEDCYNKLRQMMKFTNSKYDETKLRIYRLRDICLTIDQNDIRHCIVRKVKKSYIDGNILITISDDVQTSENSIPKLKKYNSVISQKNRKIEYNGMTISFVEERTDDHVINYIELKTSSSKLTSKEFKEVISLISYKE